MPARRKILIEPKKDTKLKDIWFNYRLKRARRNCGFSQYILGIYVGVSFNTISSYERLRAFPKPEIAERIACALNVEVEDIFSERIREIGIEAREERRGIKERPNYIYLGSNLNELEEKLIKLDEKALIPEMPEYLITSYTSYSNLRKEIERVLKTLTREESEVIMMRFGLGKYDKEYSFTECGRKLHLTRERE